MQERYEKQGAHEGEVLGKAGLAADHPDPETIVAYRHQSLSEEETERIQEHLEHCADCLDLLLLGDDGESVGEPGVLDFEKEMVWARLKAERMEGEAEDARRRTAAALAKRRMERFGIAAAVLLALLPLGGFSFHQKTVISELTSPQLNVAIHDVLPQRSPTRQGPGRGSQEAGVFEVPPGTQFYTIVIPIGSREPGSCRVEILGSTGRPIWSEEGLEIDRLGFATLGLSRHFLKPGNYRIRVFKEGEEKQPVGDYPIEIRHGGRTTK